MRIKAFFLALLICVFPSVVFAGKPYYVDCGANLNGDGSFTRPWNNIKSVNNKMFGKGDDVYFKVNTVCMPDKKLVIDWDGTTNDRIIIGAYYGENQFGLNGNKRPIIDGQNNVPTSEYDALIIMGSESMEGHVTFENLRINNSKYIALQTNYIDDVIVDNCYVYQAGGSGIILARCNTGLVKNNTVIHASTIPGSHGAAITATGMREIGATTNVTIEYNTIRDSHEGIGLYKKADGNIVQYNTVYDCHTYHIYVGSSKNNTVRYNLVYKSYDGGTEGSTPGEDSGIVLNNEGWHAPECHIGGNIIHNNLVAGFNKGINISNEVNNCAHNDNKIYNNTLADNNFNIWFKLNGMGKLSGMIYSGNEVKNNISYTITPGAVHSNIFALEGITWDNNNFDEAVSKDAQSGNAQIYSPGLTKTSGWRSLKSGAVKGNEFSLQPNSRNINNGLSIDGYNERIFSANFAINPITINIRPDSTPSIGAWMEYNSKLSLIPPKNLNIIKHKQSN
jgi:parallel beta-helix repeat protein